MWGRAGLHCSLEHVLSAGELLFSKSLVFCLRLYTFQGSCFSFWTFLLELLTTCLNIPVSTILPSLSYLLLLYIPSQCSFSQLHSFLSSLSQGYMAGLCQSCASAECRIPHRGGSHPSPHHFSCWSVRPFLGPAHEELWRFSWAGVGLLEDIC